MEMVLRAAPGRARGAAEGPDAQADRRPLADAEIWAAVCSLMSLPFMHDEAIPIQPISDAIPDDAELLVLAGERRVLVRGIPVPHPPARGLVGAWERRVERVGAVGELRVQSGASNECSNELRRSSRPRSTAMNALASCAASPWMQTAVTLPAVLHGYLNPGDPTRGFEGGPTIAWWLEALPAEEPLRVEIELEHEDRREEHHAMFVEQARRGRALRTRHRAWLDSTSHSSVLGVFSLFSAQEVVYDWLWNDLKRIRWVDGNLGERART